MALYFSGALSNLSQDLDQYKSHFSDGLSIIEKVADCVGVDVSVCILSRQFNTQSTAFCLVSKRITLSIPRGLLDRDLLGPPSSKLYNSPHGFGAIGTRILNSIRHFCIEHRNSNLDKTLSFRQHISARAKGLSLFCDALTSSGLRPDSYTRNSIRRNKESLETIDVSSPISSIQRSIGKKYGKNCIFNRRDVLHRSFDLHKVTKKTEVKKESLLAESFGTIIFAQPVSKIIKDGSTYREYSSSWGSAPFVGISLGRGDSVAYRKSVNKALSEFPPEKHAKILNTLLYNDFMVVDGIDAGRIIRLILKNMDKMGSLE